MSEMVDRVAAAIVASYGTPVAYKFVALPEFSREAARKCARAAIEAMRDLPEDVVTAMAGTDAPDRLVAHTFWQAGVTAILTENEALRD